MNLSMQFKKDDLVKLLPFWPFDNAPASPIWGSDQGYLLGRVVKTITHSHSKNDHVVEVEWGFPGLLPRKTPLPCGKVPEQYLSLVDETDEKIAEEFHLGCGMTKDVYALIRTHTGKFALNVVEAYPFGTSKPAFIAGVTKNVLKNVAQEDYLVVNEYLSMTDQCDIKIDTFFRAVNTIYKTWDLPELRAIELPLPEFDTIKAAAATCPEGTDAGICLFHTPRNLVDFATLYPCD